MNSIIDSSTSSVLFDNEEDFSSGLLLKNSSNDYSKKENEIDRLITSNKKYFEKYGNATSIFRENEELGSEYNIVSLNEESSFFNVISKLYGVIQSVNLDEKLFTVIFRNEDDCIKREAILSFSDVDEVEQSKVIKGARLIYLYGKLYVKGTAYNSAKILFRAENTWNKYKIKELHNEANRLIELFKKNDI